MEISNNMEVQDLNTTTYPDSVNETKSVFNPQALLWALIAIVFFAIYYQQPEKDTTLGIMQIILVIMCAVLAVIKLCSGNRKLTYTPTGSPVVLSDEYYNVTLEDDIRQCLKEGNISRLNALKTDDSGGIQIEKLESKDKIFTAVRMYKYYPEGYRPVTGWVVL